MLTTVQDSALIADASARLTARRRVEELERVNDEPLTGEEELRAIGTECQGDGLMAPTAASRP
jgi:hypothetical protein